MQQYSVTENGKLVAKYTYDGLNRLVREETADFGVIAYSYDTAGNVIRKAVNGEEYVYTYPQSGWKDQLHQRSYKDAIGQEVIETFAYDGLGNPTVYRNKVLSWQCRRLKQYGNTIFTYDANGVRTSKTNNGILTKYIYDGNNLVAEQRNGSWIYYIYSAEGIAGFNNGFTYLFRKNLQGDVTHIYKQLPDNTYEQVAQYTYDAWGNCKILQDADGIGSFNPFRYRGYYFDEETGLYYLQTRYYDPELCRFISADSIEYLDPETLGGLNLYAYCNNNPVMRTDSVGTDWNSFWNGVAYFFRHNWDAIVGTVASVALVAGGLAVTVFSDGTLSWLGSTLVGAGVGSFLGGMVSKANGGSYWDGYLGGIVSGGLTGLGTLFGPVLSFIGGAAGNAFGSLITDSFNHVTMDENYYLNLLAESLIAGIVNIGAAKFNKVVELLRAPGLTDVFVGATVFAEFAFTALYEDSKEFIKSFAEWLRWQFNHSF